MNAGRPGDAGNKFTADMGISVGFWIGQNLESKRLQAIAGQDRGRLIISLVGKKLELAEDGAGFG